MLKLTGEFRRLAGRATRRVMALGGAAVLAVTVGMVVAFSATEVPAVADDDPSGGATFSGTGPISISVTPSSRELDTVAIPRPFCNADKGPCTQVLETLVRDMTLSGYFKVLPQDSYFANMNRESLTQTKWEDWFNVKAKFLIKAEVTAAGKDKFTLHLRLYDVVQRKTIAVKHQDFKDVKSGKLRSSVHKFVNEVMRAITGSPGFFGGSILYTAKTGLQTRGVYAIEVDGVGRASLAVDETINLFPSMSGGHFLYTSFRFGKPDLILDDERLTFDERHYRGARVSPDGKVIAASIAMEDGQADIWLLNMKGEPVQNLTNSAWDEVHPAWSPSGGQLAFVSNKSGGPQIYVMGRGGGDARRLTMAGSYNAHPDFGPDGLLVFAGMDEATSDIFTVDLGSSMTRVTQDQGFNKDPTISPDGRHVAFVSDRDGKWKIWLSTIDGRYQFPLTQRGGTYATLFWAR